MYVFFLITVNRARASFRQSFRMGGSKRRGGRSPTASHPPTPSSASRVMDSIPDQPGDEGSQEGSDKLLDPGGEEGRESRVGPLQEEEEKDDEADEDSDDKKKDDKLGKPIRKKRASTKKSSSQHAKEEPPGDVKEKDADSTPAADSSSLTAGVSPSSETPGLNNNLPSTSQADIHLKPITTTTSTGGARGPRPRDSAQVYREEEEYR